MTIDKRQASSEKAIVFMRPSFAKWVSDAVSVSKFTENEAMNNDCFVCR
jgi:hypothetical protein